MSRRAPRPLSAALTGLRERLEPAGGLAAVQSAWREAAGPAVAHAAHPTALRGGLLTIECESAVWAQELQLMAPDLIERLGEHLDAEPIESIRCTVTGVGR